MSTYKIDDRIETILKQITKFEKFDFHIQKNISKKNDEIDMISDRLNILGGVLGAKINDLENNQNRLNALMDTLVRYTKMDFSVKADISEKRDELDAISAGVNTLVEELEYRIKETKQSEERFRLLIENVNDYAIYMIDNDGYIISWNKGAEHIKEYTEREVIGKHFSIFYTPKQISDGEPEYNLKTTKERGHYKCEGWRVKKDGTQFWADITFNAIYDSFGKIHGFSKITRDMTERKVTELELKESQNFLDSVIENIPNMVFVKDANDLKFIRFNKAGEELLGYSKEDLIGKNDYDFFSKEQADSFTSYDKSVLNSGMLKDISEETINTKYKGKRILETKKIPIMDGKGRPKYLLGISNDITERKIAERKLKEKSEELVRSNADLEQFAYVASHDLQEPLRMITSYVQLLEKRYKDKLDQDANEFIAFAVDGSNRMRTLINSLLEYSRVNRVKPFQEVNMSELMKEVLQNLEDQIKKNEAIIHMNKLPDVYGDPVLLNQLFQNLISNAIKFKGDKHPEITISGKKINQEYLFSVKDNGIGINKEYANKIFVIFQRLHSQEKYPGTGIGLAICKKIVERHHGQISIESEVGKGSTFYFTLRAK